MVFQCTAQPKASCHAAACVAVAVADAVADAEHELARVTEFTRQTFAVLSRALATGY